MVMNVTQSRAYRELSLVVLNDDSDHKPRQGDLEHEWEIFKGA